VLKNCVRKSISKSCIRENFFNFDQGFSQQALIHFWDSNTNSGLKTSVHVYNCQIEFYSILVVTDYQMLIKTILKVMILFEKFCVKKVWVFLSKDFKNLGLGLTEWGRTSYTHRVQKLCVDFRLMKGTRSNTFWLLSDFCSQRQNHAKICPSLRDDN